MPQSSPARDDAGRNLERLHRILEAARLLNSTLDLHELTATILRIVRDQVHVDRGTVFVLDRDGGQLRSLVAQDVTGREIVVPLTRGICGAVGATGEPIWIPDAYADPRFDPSVDGALGYRTRDIYCLPIVNRDGATVGVLELLNTTRPITPEDEAFLGGVSVHIGLALENARLHAEMVEKRKMERELHLAREIQQNLCPVFPPVVSGIEIAASSEMCGAVGGDYLDYFLLEGNRVLLALGDVSGKGMGAALVMSSVHASCRALVRHVHGIEQIVDILNGTLVESTREGIYVTFVFLLVDSAAGKLHHVNAGHNPPLYVGPHGEATFLDGSGGPPAGLFEHVRYQREVCALEPGAVVIMYTDGVVEAENPAGEEFGTDRLVSAVSQVRDRPASEIRARIETELDQFLAGTPPRDDTTFIVVRRPA
jgi:serine phosphatase RsbU (regulator of sigma subunit)